MSKSTLKPAGESAPAGQAKPAPVADVVPAITLNFKEKHALLQRAQNAGADADTVKDMTERLSAATLTRGQLDEVELEVGILVEAYEKKLKTYWVKPGEKLMRQGEVYPERSPIKLSPDEARVMAAVLSDTKPPDTPVTIAKRGPGKYRVKGPGKVKHGGAFHAPGAVLELDAEDARSAGDAVEPV